MEYYYSSSEINKAIKRLEEDIARLKHEESINDSFKASMVENIEDVRPEYDYNAVQAKLAELEGKQRYLKHQLNCFNTTSMVEDFDMTIDEVLVYMPQLTEKKNKYHRMLMIPPKSRVSSFGGGSSAIIDYEYINYNLKDVEGDYNAVRDRLTLLQQNLDKINNEKRISLRFPL